MSDLLDRFRSLAEGIPILVYAVPIRGGFEFYIVLYREAWLDSVEGIYNALTEEFPKADFDFLYFTPEDWECVRVPADAVRVCGRENRGE